MSHRVFNFSAGPAMLPTEVLEKSAAALLDYQGKGFGIAECSHRGKEFEGVMDETIQRCKQLLGLGDTHDVLLLQGGATQLFTLIPMNFDTTSADYLVGGEWSKKAASFGKEAGKVNIVATSEASNFDHSPAASEWKMTDGDVADALAGPKSAATKETNAWFCRCWSLCAMCLGCCVARVRNVSELDACARNYLRCLGECFRSLTCGLTGPTGCVSGETDVLSGRVVQPVVGSAYGFSFSHYTIEVTDAAGDILSGVIIYPDNSGNPNTSLTQGNFAIASGTLGWVDLQQCLLAAGIEVFTSTTFTVTLHVFAVDGTELSPDCVTSFQLSLAQVYIEQISTCWSVNFTNPDEPLRVSDSSMAALATVGGAMAIAGAANIIGCASQAIASYSIWAIPDPNFSFPQPPQLSSITPLPNWTQVANIVYAAQTIAQPFPQPPANFSVDQVRALNELSGTPGPSTLTNTWGVGSECFIFPPHLIICDNVPSLTGFEFQSLTLPTTAAGLQPGTGKFTFLLQVSDSAGNQYYDIQRAWIDNENVVGIITGIGGLPHCADLYTQNSNSVFQTVNINGTAWDQIIDISTPDYTKPTSDNFANYTVTFNKQGATSSPAVLISSASPVPARPLPLGVGTLAPWNLQILDAASNPMGLPADQLLAPGEACTYDVILNVNDSTMVDENHNHAISPYTFPIKIINSPHP